MANVVHRSTLQFLPHANTPDFPEPTWKHDPDLSAVAGVPDRYWKAPADWDAVGAGPVEMTQGEKDAVDAAALADLVAPNRAQATADVDTTEQHVGWMLRAVVGATNMRDNYLVNRIAELQADLQAVKATSGAADNIRAAISASYLATATRPRADAMADYKAEISTGTADT